MRSTPGEVRHHATNNLLPVTNTYTDKHLLAVKCLAAAHAIDPANPTLHLQLLRFRKTLDGLSEPLPEKVAEAVNAEFDKLLTKSQNLEEWNESFLSSNKASALHVQSGLSARQLLKPESKAQCEKELLATLDLPEITIDEATIGLESLNEWGSDKTAYAEKASKKWPESSVFALN